MSLPHHSGFCCLSLSLPLLSQALKALISHEPLSFLRGATISLKNSGRVPDKNHKEIPG